MLNKKVMSWNTNVFYKIKTSEFYVNKIQLPLIDIPSKKKRRTCYIKFILKDYL